MKMTIIFATTLFLFTTSASAQEGTNPIEKAFFAPELIERYQKEINLSKEQRQFMVEQMADAQADFIKLNFNLQEEMNTLTELANQPAATEERLLQQLDKVLDLERQIKRRQLTLLIRLRNKLTTEQRGKLMERRQ